MHLYGRYRLGTVCLCHPQQLLDSDFTGGLVRRANRSSEVGESRSGFFRWRIVRFAPCRRALPSCSVLDRSRAKCAHPDRIPWHVCTYRFPPNASRCRFPFFAASIRIRKETLRSYFVIKSLRRFLVWHVHGTVPSCRSHPLGIE